MTNILVSTIILIFLFSLYIMGAVIITLHARKLSEEEFRQNEIIKKMGWIILPIASGILLIIFSVNQFTEFSIIQLNDVSNWITITVEIGVGLGIAVLILIYSQFVSKKIIKKLEKDVDKLAYQVNVLTTASQTQIQIPLQVDTSQEDTSQEEVTSSEDAYSSPGQPDDE